MFWNEKYERLERKELETLQVRRLRKLVETVYEKVPFYRKKLSEKAIVPSQITSLESLTHLPFTTK
ncbi:MAG TPA: phenylacetate--CoA ligase, partial [Firmicutes bacterium]|nr:phenylacetate--CoA ligase [Bacillota bacterium]